MANKQKISILKSMGVLSDEPSVSLKTVDEKYLVEVTINFRFLRKETVSYWDMSPLLTIEETKDTAFGLILPFIKDHISDEAWELFEMAIEGKVKKLFYEIFPSPVGWKISSSMTFMGQGHTLHSADDADEAIRHRRICNGILNFFRTKPKHLIPLRELVEYKKIESLDCQHLKIRTKGDFRVNGWEVKYCIVGRRGKHYFFEIGENVNFDMQERVLKKAYEYAIGPESIMRNDRKHVDRLFALKNNGSLDIKIRGSFDDFKATYKSCSFNVRHHSAYNGYTVGAKIGCKIIKFIDMKDPACQLRAHAKDGTIKELITQPLKIKAKNDSPSIFGYEISFRLEDRILHYFDLSTNQLTVPQNGTLCSALEQIRTRDQIIESNSQVNIPAHDQLEALKSEGHLTLNFDIEMDSDHILTYAINFSYAGFSYDLIYQTNCLQTICVWDIVLRIVKILDILRQTIELSSYNVMKIHLALEFSCNGFSPLDP